MHYGSVVCSPNHRGVCDLISESLCPSLPVRMNRPEPYHDRSCASGSCLNELKDEPRQVETSESLG
jgi:hypothetical protein